MTVLNVSRWIAYGGDGSTAVFSYPFQLLSAAELQVYVTGNLAASGYTVTGVGVPTGGTVVFFTPPSVGSVIFLRGYTGRTQQHDYDASASLPFSATGHEAALDKLTLLVQELLEELERRPAFAVAVLSALRNMALPTPQALQLLGWNATADGLTNYASAIQQVTVSSTAHIAYGENTVTVPTAAGEVQLLAGGAFPAGVLRLGALVRVSADFGDTGGLSTFSLGDGRTLDRWGAGLARLATSAPIGANTPGMFRGQGGLEATVGAEDVVLTAETGVFDADGEAIITAGYLTLVAA